MSRQLVRDLMHIGVPTCSADTLLTDAVAILLRDRLESLIVLDRHGHAAGIFGQEEAIAAFGLSGAKAGGYKMLTVADAMRPEIPEILPDIPATAAAQIMLDKQVRNLFLMHHDGGIKWPAAVLRFEDVLNHLVC